MRRAPLAAALLLALLPTSPSRAEDPGTEAASPLAVFGVGGLVQGRTRYIPGRLGAVPNDEVNEELHPIFGGEAEEPWLPVGTADELVELLRSQVAPDSWSNLGTDARVLGWRSLIVRQSPEVLRQVGAALRGLEDRWLRPVTIEVVALRLPSDAPAAPTSEALAALAAGPEAGPGLRLSTLPGQRAVAFVGRQQAYLQEYDVEVCSKASASDPIVGTLISGLSVGCHALPDAEGRFVRLTLALDVALLRALETAPAGEGRKVETPLLDRVRAHASADVTPGTWTMFDGGSARAGGRALAFLARVTLAERPAASAAAGTSIPVLETGASGPLVDRSYDVTRLTQPVLGRATESPVDLVPSGGLVRAPPELREPEPALHEDALLEILRSAVAPDIWGMRGAALEVRKGTLIVRASQGAQDGVARALASLERALAWGVDVDVEVLEVPAATPLPAGPVLAPEEAARLLAAASAEGGRRLDRVRVSSLGGARNHVFVGDERTIVSDYEVEIAEDASIFNPVVDVLATGVTLDVEPALTASGDAVVLAARFVRSELVALRSVASTAGEIQCPEVRITKLRQDLEVPFGRVGLLGATLEGDKRVLVLLAPRRLAQQGVAGPRVAPR